MITIENNIYPHPFNLTLYISPIHIKTEDIQREFGRYEYSGSYHLNYKITNNDEVTIVPFTLDKVNKDKYMVSTTNKHWAMEIISFLLNSFA